MSADTTEANTTEMIACQDCGVMVPERNMMVHCAAGCRGVARSSTQEEDEQAKEEDQDDNSDVIDLCESPHSRKRDDEDVPSTPPPRRRQRRGQPKRDDADDMEIDDSSDEHDEVEVVEQGNKDVVDLLNDDDDEWACTKCTLLNDNSKSRCDACGSRNPTVSAYASAGMDSDGVRTADPVRRERLIDDDFLGSGGSPLSMIGGSALLGGLVGATGAYMRGRPVSSGALEGGVAGAMGGAFLSEFYRSPDRQGQASRPTTRSTSNPYSGGSYFRDTSLSEARSAGANGQPAYPVMGSSATRRSSRQPRASIRDSGAPGRMSYGGSGGNIDRMSYDQLLAAFGDGTENLGASGGAIASLPTSKVKTKEDGSIDLPADACECSICLEEFEKGQIRKTLPCLHGFHNTCVDKWLKTNGACPVCKFRVDQRNSSSS